MNKIVVIGGDHHNTLGVLRGLGERGISSDLILISKSERTFVDKCKYINKTWKIDGEDKLLSTLLKCYKNENEKPVVICCSDSSSGYIDEHRDRLHFLFNLPGGKTQGCISELMSKKKMANLALEVGLEIPQTYYVDDAHKELSQIKLPCIIKPIESRKGSKTEIAICNSLEELQTYAKTHNLKHEQVQDYIDKDFEFQLIGCSTKDKVIIPGVSRILRPCKGSNTSFLHYTPLEKDFCEIEKCKEYVRRTGYRGLFSLEFLRDKDGRDLFMEINFRNDGNAICVTAAGISLPYIWYLDCIGKNYNDELHKEVSPVYVMPDMAELKLLFTRQISLSMYLKDLFKTDRFMEFDKKDIKPFIHLILKELHL